MKVALIARSTLYAAPGGDSVQIMETAKHLNKNGITADIKLACETIDYAQYDMLHFFNITRPADMLKHTRKSKKPFVVSTNFVDYSNYDRHQRKGLAGFIFRLMSSDYIEYAKTILRFALKKDRLVSPSYIFKGQRKSIIEILNKAKLILPNSEMEYAAITNSYNVRPKYEIVPNGISKELFQHNNENEKNRFMVVCAARIEGIKNQLNLIKALNNSAYQLSIIGKPAPNQLSYYNECKNIAASNINFIDHLPQKELLAYYRKAKVHILPSWFETTGLSSLEAATMGCNIVITDRGYTKEYFGDDAIYCNPDSPESIVSAVAKASRQPQNFVLQKKILSNFTWEQASLQTIKAYRAAIENQEKLRIGILSTRGIPNRYGGFEQLAEYLSPGLVKKGHEVIVYNSHRHPYNKNKWNNVSLVRCYDPEHKIGSAGQFIYDFNCVIDARKRDLDVLLVLGYTSMSVWGSLFPKKSVAIFNMDGFEWKRDKYSALAKKFLLKAEKLAIKAGDYFISDSTIIKNYFQKKYAAKTEFIAYGAEIRHDEDETVLDIYRVKKNNYFLVVARIEPENNVQMILDGFSASNSKNKMIVIGNVANQFGRHLVKKFAHDNRIQFPGAMYDKHIKHSLCFFSEIYFHGHSTGGTNPSLLEAMGSRALIAAYKNDFNKEVLKENAFYFSNADDIKNIIENTSFTNKEKMVANNVCKVKTDYNWNAIIDHYEKFIVDCYKLKKS